MKHLDLAFLSGILAAAMLAGCGGSPDSSLPVGGLGALRDAAMTMPHFVRRPVHTDHGKSWMDPAYGVAGAHKKQKSLLYVGDDGTNDVYVYDFKSGKQVGTLTGFNGPYGMCVDATGDVYISNFDNGTVVEYAHGGTTVLNTYKSGGEPIGCSVDANGDVAATSFDPGEVTVFARGDRSKGKTYSDPDCEFFWTAGYDDKGNLIGEGEYSFIAACALLAGAKSMTTLSESGITIDFPAGTMWDGKYVALGDQEAGGTFEDGVWPATLSGSTLTAASQEVKFALPPSCGSYGDQVNPFILGKTNTPVNHHQGKVELGFDPCSPSVSAVALSGRRRSLQNP